MRGTSSFGQTAQRLSCCLSKRGTTNFKFPRHPTLSTPAGEATLGRHKPLSAPKKLNTETGTWIVQRRWQSQTALAEEPAAEKPNTPPKEGRDAFIQRQRRSKVTLSPAAFALKHRLGVQDALSDELFLQALTHKSFEHGWVPSNERLAFLGTFFQAHSIRKGLTTGARGQGDAILRDRIRAYEVPANALGEH